MIHLGLTSTLRVNSSPALMMISEGAVASSRFRKKDTYRNRKSALGRGPADERLCAS